MYPPKRRERARSAHHLAGQRVYARAGAITRNKYEGVFQQRSALEEVASAWKNVITYALSNTLHENSRIHKQA